MLTAEQIERIVAVQPVKQAAFEAGASAWVAWNGTTYGTTSTTNNLTWEMWSSSTTGSTASCNTTTSTVTWVQPNWTSWNTDYEETAEQRAAREQARAERERQRAEANARYAAEEAERQAVRERASARAQGLLLSLLSDEQAASYREHGWFEVRGSSGRRWRIRNRGQSGNVDLMPEIGEERDMTFCAHPPGSLPAADAHVAQMLALVTDDEAFERVANVHYRRPGSEPPFMRAVA